MFVPSSTLSAPDLEHQIVALAHGMRAQLATWLMLVAELDGRGRRAVARFRSTAEWLAWACQLSARTARDYVRVARRLTELPLVAAAFAAGELSYSQVRAITRASPSEDEAALLAVAQRSTTAQLERHVRALRSAASADPAVARDAHQRRCLEWFYGEDGSLRFYGRLAADTGAAFVEAVETAAAALHPELERAATPDGWRPPSRTARRADALAEIALSGSPRTHVVLHVDPGALACTAGAGADRAGEVCALEDGPAIPSELARRLSCDADVSVAGLNLGRTQRVISPALRRALEARDGRRCAMPGCDRRHGLAGHHVVHWAHGGGTDLHNLVLLCAYHHRLVHEEGVRMRLVAGELDVRDRGGRQLRTTPDRAPPLAAAA